MTVSEDGDLGVLAKKLSLGKKELLEEALTHPANKRIGWIGDAILYLAVTEHLYRTSNKPTSELDPERQKVIKNPTLKKAVAEQLHLNDYIHVPPGERDPNAEGILATAYEALTGAIFLEKGYESAADHVRKTLLSTTIQPTASQSSPT